jgi:hypothetical protein
MDHVELDVLEEAFLRRLMVAACRSAEWSLERDVPAEQRWSRAIQAHRIAVTGGNLELEAWIDDDLALVVSARIGCAWTDADEKTLFDAMDEHPSLVAGLVVINWAKVRAVCAQSASQWQLRTGPVAIVRAISPRSA